MLKKVDEVPKSFDYLLGGFLTLLHDRTSKSKKSWGLNFILLLTFHAISRLWIGQFCWNFDPLITTFNLQNSGENRISLSLIQKGWELTKDCSSKWKITTTHDFLWKTSLEYINKNFRKGICPHGFFEYLCIIEHRKKNSERGVFDFLLGVIGTWV